MAKGKDQSLLEQRIGYRFRDKSLLCRALTHSSYTNESRAKNHDCPSNERLEFLGDAVLQILISDYLFHDFPEDPEGNLTRLRQHLVCEATLAELAAHIRLGEYLLLGRGEEQSGGRTRPSVLADAFEALLAAIYLDNDGRAEGVTREVLMTLMQRAIPGKAAKNIDYKSRLQQLVQQDGGEELTYEVTKEEGPAHERTFEVVAKINSNVVGSGTGKSKREAEQLAAQQALSLFGITD
ncbi:MAG: ribonuclease III [Eubacteriales bacterium]